MAEMARGFEIELIEDPIDPYFTGSQAWFSSIFDHYSTSVVGEDEAGEVTRYFDLGQLAETVPEADQLRRRGFLIAGQVGKLSTFDRGAVNELAVRKSRDASLVLEAATPEVGFKTSLFVAERISDFRDDLPGIEDLPTNDLLYYRIAGVTNESVTDAQGKARQKRVLSLVQGGHQDEALYLPVGRRLKPTGLPEAIWADIDALHSVLQAQTIEVIRRKVLMDELAGMLTLRQLESN